MDLNTVSSLISLLLIDLFKEVWFEKGVDEERKQAHTLHGAVLPAFTPKIYHGDPVWPSHVDRFTMEIHTKTQLQSIVSEETC